ncbi:MAG: glycosyltransferase family 2 protein [bacterium]|nr:glycosyltransferase family 2 protein [bacterium]
MNVKTVSVVVPCFNEEANVPLLHARVSAVFAALPYTLELVLVNDGSRDGTEAAITALAHTDARVVGVMLSRNFGHQAATTAGLDQATGDAVVLIDADLQDPPEVIAEMLKVWEQGFDVVYGMRVGETFMKKTTAKLSYRMLRAMTSIEIPLDTGDFRLMTRPVVEAVKRMPEHARFLRGMVSWVGFKQTGVLYERASRAHGETKYPYRKMIKFAWDAITSFSTLPLKVATWVGFGVALLSVAVMAWSVVARLLQLPGLLPGWTSQFVAMLFLGGVQLFFLGMIGEYVGRIFDEVKGRPLYVVKQVTRTAL